MESWNVEFFLMRLGDGKVWCELLKCGSKKSCTE